MRPVEPESERQWRERLGLERAPVYEEHTERGARPARDPLEALDRTPRTRLEARPCNR